MKIVNAEEKHIPAIHTIYAHHVLHGTASFETDPPDTREMLVRLTKIRELGLPWVVALQDEKSSATVISPAIVNAMPTVIRSKIRFILIRQHNVRVRAKRYYTMSLHGQKHTATDR